MNLHEIEKDKSWNESTWNWENTKLLGETMLSNLQLTTNSNICWTQTILHNIEQFTKQLRPWFDFKVTDSNLEIIVGNHKFNSLSKFFFNFF